MGFEDLPEGCKGKPEGSEGLSEGSEGLLEGSKGVLEDFVPSRGRWMFVVARHFEQYHLIFQRVDKGSGDSS